MACRRPDQLRGQAFGSGGKPSDRATASGSPARTLKQRVGETGDVLYGTGRERAPRPTLGFQFVAVLEMTLVDGVQLRGDGGIVDQQTGLRVEGQRSGCRCCSTQ